MERRTSAPEEVSLAKWLSSIVLLPFAMLPAFLMAQADFNSFLNNFQFITTYPYLLAVSFNDLRRADSQLNQGSLFAPESSRGVNRGKLLLATLFWDTPLAMSLSLTVSLTLGHSSSERAVLLLQTVSCLWTAPIAGLLFPVIDVASYAVNFVPFLMVTEPLAPVREAVETAIIYSGNGDWINALIPGCIFLCAAIRLALGWYRLWIVPGISKFIFALGISVLGTAIISQLPSVGEGTVLLKAMMTVTTAVMVLNHGILNQTKLVFIWRSVKGTQARRKKRLHIELLYAIYSVYSAFIIAIGTSIKGGLFSYELFKAFSALIVSCYICIELSKFMNKVRVRSWNRFYRQTEPIVDDGASAIVSKLLILFLQGLPK